MKLARSFRHLIVLRGTFIVLRKRRITNSSSISNETNPFGHAYAKTLVLEVSCVVPSCLANGETLCVPLSLKLVEK